MASLILFFLKELFICFQIVDKRKKTILQYVEYIKKKKLTSAIFYWNQIFKCYFKYILIWICTELFFNKIPIKFLK